MSPSATLVKPNNRLLSALSSHEFEQLLPHLRHVELDFSDVLYNEGACVDRIYFVDSGIISLVLTSRQGIDVESGLIGSEGIMGAGPVLASGMVAHRVVVQMQGSAWQMPADKFREEFKRGGMLQNLVLRFQEALSVQTAQCSLCNNLHSVEQRLSRWLLMIRDRVESDHLELTQEFIANMLGVRRSGVTVAAGTLRDIGLIEYHRGQVIIHDAKRLEKTSCECYTQINKHYQELLP